MKRKRSHSLFVALAMLFLAAAGMAGPAWAIRPDEVLPSPVQEARARAIGRELRCLVCQNESIDDSDADLAHDLRLLVRQRIVAGDTDEQVKQYLVSRYGTYVLLKPPFNPQTVLLWLGPLALLIGGFCTAAIFYRRGAGQTADLPISADEKRRVAALLGKDSIKTGGP